MKENMIINDDCVKFLSKTPKKDLQIDLSFLDPPFNQGKDYRVSDDDIPEEEYWIFMKRVCRLIYNRTSDGGSIYFMQREKNTARVMKVLEDTGWTYQNLIIWKKKTSAVPQNNKFGLHYQIIVFATKGDKPRVFNKLRINPPRLITERYERPNGMYVTDVWDDIRELTSGYFAGDEALRMENGERFHKQQSPVALLLRIILSSSNIGDLVFDPFAGTGTTLVVAKQLSRKYIGIEIDPVNTKKIEERLRELRPSDSIDKYRRDYYFTENLNNLWTPRNADLDREFLFSKNLNGENIST
ncbi:MAG: site-specific DNA-methyltransferase [Thermoplasmatales archaeon]|nr:site-specific DNA-methyltransferase [Thermoplasmatales archaeon]